MNGVISRVTILIPHIRGLITPLITTHEPASKPSYTALFGTWALISKAKHPEP